MASFERLKAQKEKGGHNPEETNDVCEMFLSLHTGVYMMIFLPGGSLFLRHEMALRKVPSGEMGSCSRSASASRIPVPGPLDTSLQIQESDNLNEWL